MDQFLRSTDIIDWQTAEIAALARSLATGQRNDTAIAAACFSWVRDEIQHSIDCQRGPVTCRASEVLRHGTGYCYAKSHLLAALLRANGIPAALCYQRLSVEAGKPPFCLHGLNAVWLADHGWYRIDARGNKPGIDAQFIPPVEQLAFPLEIDGEADLPGFHADPLPLIIDALTKADSWQTLAANLPDQPLPPPWKIP